MKHSTARKFVAVTPPAAIVDNAALTTAAIDTKGFKQLTFICHFGAIDIAIASMSVRHSDASNMGSPATLSTGGTDFTLPIATDDNSFATFNVDLKGKKRYLDLEVTGGDGTLGTYLTVFAELSRAEETPSGLTSRGLALEVQV
jgi:hypothetical protein